LAAGNGVRFGGPAAPAFWRGSGRRALARVLRRRSPPLGGGRSAIGPADAPAGGLDLLARRFREAVRFNGQRRREVAFAKHLHGARRPDQPGGAQRVDGHSGTGIEAREVADVHLFVVDPERVTEAALVRHPAHERQLAALEARADAASRSGLLALQALRRVGAVAARVAAADALALVRGALRRA